MVFASDKQSSSRLHLPEHLFLLRVGAGVRIGSARGTRGSNDSFQLSQELNAASQERASTKGAFRARPVRPSSDCFSSLAS